jgi:hypothetical protein
MTRKVWFVNTKARHAKPIRRILQVIGDKFYCRDVTMLYEPDGMEFIRKPQGMVSVNNTDLPTQDQNFDVTQLDLN